MKRSLGLCLLLVLCVSSVFVSVHGTVHAKTKTTYSIQTFTNVAYGPMADELLDECLPIGATTPRPGVIMIHGGGWSGGDKSKWESLCQSYAASGFDAATINYRLAGAKQTYPWPDPLGDIQLAVRYFRANATSLNLDPTRLCSFGNSSGAHYALLLDTIQTIQPSDVSNLLTSYSSKVECVGDEFGPTDLPLLYNEVQADDGLLYQLLDKQTPSTNLALYTSASPVTYVNSSSGQAMIIQGTLDTTVPPDQSQELQTDLQNAGVSVNYVSYVGGHGFTGLTGAQVAAIWAQLAAWYAQVLQP